MCGLAGWLASPGQGAPDPAAAVARMMELVAHRGPDDAGIYREAGLALGHRRLSILDPSPAGHQPMGTPDGRYVLVYNGEVYNFRRLARELGGLGWTFRSGSDTEVLLAAYAAWGIGALERFDGMFALALWDRERRELLLARDRAGIKPLYYHAGSRGIVFASEVKALWRVLDCSPDPSALADVVLAGSLHGHGTLLSGVSALLPGEYLVCGENGAVRSRGFFHTLAGDVDPEVYAAADALGDREHVERLDAMLQASVEMHLASDAPVGALCSGGVDSSLLTALAYRRHPDVSIFHATYDGGGSEEPYARRVARHLGCTLHYARMTREYYLGHMVRAVWHLDVPSYHPNDISLYSVCDLAHRHGCKVLLSGEGADELFGGYGWHGESLRAFRRAERVRRLLRFLGSRGGSALRRLADAASDALFLRGEGLWHVAAPQGNQRLLAHAAQGFLGRGGRWADWRNALARYGFVGSEAEQRALAHMFTDLSGHLGTILWRTDRLGMMASVENRVPILENEIMRYGVNLPLRLKIRGKEGKWVLKRVAERYLPREVVYRPKAGFPVPWASYLPPRSPALWEGGFVSEHFGLSSGMLEAWVAETPLLRWRLLNLEIWARLFVHRTPPEEVEEWFARGVGIRAGAPGLAGVA